MVKRRKRADPVEGEGTLTEETANSRYSDVREALGSALAPGTELAGKRLRILRTLGRGGTGVLYEASDALRGCKVALKQLRYQGPEAQYALKLEFRALRDVSHPNLVRLHELFADDTGCFFTMDLVEGDTFTHWVRPHGRFSESRLRPALLALLDAVHAIHEAGKLHRDLKPSNVLVSHAGQVVVLDFGLVVDSDRYEQDRRTQHGLEKTLPNTALYGTPQYMAPELMRGVPPSAASDLYAIGVMMFEAFTGKLPFEGSGYSLLLSKRDLQVELPAELTHEVSAALRDICLSLLSREPALRPSLEELREALRASELQQLVASERESSELGSQPVIDRDSASQRPSSGEPGQRRPSRIPGSLALIGRESELSQLTAAWQRCLSGKLMLVLLGGESGIGKTAVCEQFLKRVHSDNKALVLAGRCYERESLPFKAIDPLIDELSRHLLGLTIEAQASFLPRDAGALVQLFPVLGRVPLFGRARPEQFRDPRELQRTAFAALVELLSRLRERRPLLLYVDDLQWMDADSTAFLRYLFVSPSAPPLLFLGSHRLEADGGKLLARVVEAARSNRICQVTGMRLGPLSTADAQRLAARFLPEDAGEAAADVARESAGSPFFVTELARFAHTVQGPQLSLSDVLRARREPLPASAQDLLEVLALVGSPVPVDVALAASGAAHADLDSLREARLARVSAEIAVRCIECFHDRIREAFSAQLSEQRIHMYYTALARALADSGRSDPELMCRFLEGSGERRAAAMQALAAADQAAAALAFEHAASLYRRALQLGSFAPREQLDTTSKLGVAFENAGHGLAAADAYERAATLSQGDIRRDFRRRAAQQLLLAGHLPRGTALLRAVCDEVGLELPLSTRRALLGNVSARLRLRFARAQLEREPVRAPSPREALQLRAARSALTGLVGYMPLQASAITGAYLLEAIHHGAVGDRVYAAGYSAFLMSVLDPDDPAVPGHLARIAALAAREESPELRGFVDLIHGTSAYNSNLFSEGRRHLARSLSDLRGCVGVEWEVDAAHVYDQLCALHSGHHADIARTTPALIEDAQRRGRRWAGSMLTGFAGSPSWLLADDAEGYRRAVAQARESWQNPGQLIWPDYVLMVGEAFLAIYTGNAYPAYTLLEQARSGSAVTLMGGARTGARLRSAGNSARWMLVHQGRCAAAALDDIRDSRRSEILTGSLQGYSAKLKERTGQTWRGFAAMFEGAVAAHRGERATALQALQRSLAHFEIDNLAMHAAAARRRMGQMLGGDRGRELVATGDAFMLSQSVVNLEATTELQCPGYRRISAA